jgi:hypothetical protein
MMRKIDRHNLDYAMERLDTFLDPSNPRCTVAPEIREAARLYLDSWVRGPLAEIIASDDNPTTSVYDWQTGQTVWPRMRS